MEEKIENLNISDAVTTATTAISSLLTSDNSTKVTETIKNASSVINNLLSSDKEALAKTTINSVFKPDTSEEIISRGTDFLNSDMKNQALEALISVFGEDTTDKIVSEGTVFLSSDKKADLATDAIRSLLKTDQEKASDIVAKGTAFFGSFFKANKQSVNENHEAIAECKNH